MKKKSKVLRIYQLGIYRTIKRTTEIYEATRDGCLCCFRRTFNIIDIAAAQEEVEAFKLKHLTRPSIVQDFGSI